MFRLILLALCALLSACITAADKGSVRADVLALEIAALENEFAATMAARDFATFSSFIAEDSVFISGTTALRGRPQVTARWKRYFELPQAPFFWRSERVQVLDSGELALSQGPVYSADGAQIGNFNSIWRRQTDGSWKVIFDHGSDYCPKATP